MRSPAAFLEPVVSFSFFIFRYSIVFNSFPSSIFAIACGASLPTMSATSIRLRKMCGIVTMYETGIVSAATDGRQRRTDGKKNAQSTHSTAGMHTCSGSGGGPPPACKGVGGSRSIAVAAAPRLGARWRRQPQRRRRAAGRGVVMGGMVKRRCCTALRSGGPHSVCAAPTAREHNSSRFKKKRVNERLALDSAFRGRWAP